MTPQYAGGIRPGVFLNMKKLTPESKVKIPPFSRQAGEHDTVVGRVEINTFLALPNEALEIIDGLNEGLTVGEVQEHFLKKYGEVPDVGDLLSLLEENGFFENPSAEEGSVRPAPGRNFHFTGISEETAQRIFSLPVLAVASAAIVLAVFASVFEPSLRPTWRHLLFSENITAMTLLLMLSGLIVTAIHEMAHLVAARSKGIFCRLGISNRMWILVAETDMTGIWSLPRRERYLPILAGILNDAMFASLVTLVLFAEVHGVWDFSPVMFLFLQALRMIYLMNIAWQFLFFVRTDLYYLYSTSFDCKNLMEDTVAYLKNSLSRALRRPLQVDQTGIPPKEMKAIRAYSMFWVVGRGAAFALLFTFTLPLMWGYISKIGSLLFHERTGNFYVLFDAVLFSALSLTITIMGLWMWIRSLRQRGGSKGEFARSTPSV